MPAPVEDETVAAEQAVAAAELKGAVTSSSESSGSSTANSKTHRKWFFRKSTKAKQKKPDKPTTETEDPFRHLPEHEAEILKRQLDVPPVKIGFVTLFRYATRNDLLIIAGSTIMAIGAGAALPLMTVIFGQLTSTFSQFFYGNSDYDHFVSQLNKFVLYFLYLGIGEWITTYLSMIGFMWTGEHIAAKIRENYLAAILRQNIGFFDKLGAGEITTRITSDTNLVQDGISEKIALTLTAIATFVTAFVIGYIKYWLLALILTSSIVAIVVSMGLGSSHVVKNSKLSLAAYAEGGTVVEEVVSSIRNATAFGTQDKLARQYDTHLVVGEKYGYRHKAILGFFLGNLMFIIFCDYALAFWQGSRFLVRGQGGVNVGDIITILLSIMMGAFSLGNVAPNIGAFTTALGAAGKMFETIDRKSPLDPTNNTGIVPDSVQGNIELRDVKHIYPSRPEVVVMDGVNLKVPAGKTTALVGPSGSGKSTVVGLVERFYDPVGGQVFLDGHDIRTLNLGFVRRNISLVSQEPTLFGTTIFQNIAYGLIGTQFQDFDPEKKRQMVEDAARMSNAHDFITQLPEGYETHVGERGFLLSGGQKQRIAIARAVISDPKILLLDEATSALDTKSEGIVQQALDKAAQGRTTIVIAHRLSTVKDADNIVVMSDGKIVEEGSHVELLEKGGAYSGLVEAQKFSRREIDDTTVDEELDEEAADSDELGPVVTKTASAKLQLNRSQSATSSVLAERKQDKQKDLNEYSLWTLIKLIGSFNKSEWHYMLIGLLLSIVSGAGNPVGAIFFAKCIISLSKSYIGFNPQSDINFWAGMYFMLAWTQLISWTGSGIAFAKCSERLVHRVRDRAFRTILRQDIGFFDKEENTAGALTSFLSTEANYVAGLSGATLGTILNVLTCLIGAFALALAVGWKLALVCIATVPVLLVCGFMRFWILARFQARAKAAYSKSAGYASENVSAIRTVASLCREKDVQQEYRNQLAAQGWKSLFSILKSTTLYASSQSLTFLCMALAFWYGGTLLAKHEYTEEQFFICFAAVIFSTQSAGTIFSFAPDMGKAKQAAAELLRLFDRKPSIDTWSSEGKDVPTMSGTIRLSNVHFRYPTRPEQPVLKGLNLTVEPGQYVALVGPSGCGKSTTISLLERFYDPLKGAVFVDDQDITTLNVNQYRNHLALVSQEPTLYQGTIRENVLLGSDRPVEQVSDAEIDRACKDANIYNFIMSLPQGFQTVVGNKGVMLSGGQKQRVAIARALLRDPKILLLDEATSALDSESEKVVQAALDNAAKGRTTIAVAHRLSTIQNAHCIYVFDSGRIVEKGTHSDLMRKKGRYFELVELQNLEKVQ